MVLAQGSPYFYPTQIQAMKAVLMLLFILLAMAISPCQANSIANNSTILPNSVTLVSGTLPVLNPADGEGLFIAGLISVSTGVVIVVAGSIVRYSSSKPQPINTGKILQGMGLAMIAIPVGISLEQSKNERRRTRRENRKPRGFKNRHHYY